MDESIEQKGCSDCGEIKAVGEFPLDRRRPDGRFPYCRECKNKRRREAYARNPEKERAGQSAYYEKNREHLMQKQANYYEGVRAQEIADGKRKNPYRKTDVKTCIKCGEEKTLASFPKDRRSEDGRKRECAICYDLRVSEPASRAEKNRLNSHYIRLKKYGITDEEYHAMLDSQKDCCLVCLQEFRYTNNNDRPNIDHDHTTGKVRGILCQKCNIALGTMDDDPVKIRALARYAETHQLAA